jgi:hypothetical protein
MRRTYGSISARTRVCRVGAFTQTYLADSEKEPIERVAEHEEMQPFTDDRPHVHVRGRPEMRRAPHVLL